MSDKGKLYTLELAILLGIGLIGFGGFLGWKISSEKFKHDESLIKTDTITIFKTDTCIVKDYDTIVENLVRYKQIAIHDTAFVFADDTIKIPITQKWYHQDSLCDVWISGYEPNLDSLHLCQRHTTEIVREKVIEREIPRFNVEADVRGIFVSDRLVGSIGAEVRYNKPKMTCSVGAAYTTDKKPVFSIGVGYRFDIK